VTEKSTKSKPKNQVNIPLLEASKILWAHLQFLYFLDVSLHI